MRPKLLAGAPLFPGRLDTALLNVLVVAPPFEEFLVRAALLGNLTPALGFARANVVAAFSFVLLHVPGWAMLGTLEAMVLEPIGGACAEYREGQVCLGSQVLLVLTCRDLVGHHRQLDVGVRGCHVERRGQFDLASVDRSREPGRVRPDGVLAEPVDVLAGRGA